MVEASAATAAGATYRVPPPPEPTQSVIIPPTELGLDLGKIAAIERATREVQQEVLGPIYRDADKETEPPPPPAPAHTIRDGQLLAGLDPEHIRLLEALHGRRAWYREDFEARARELGLFPDGAIETINDWAYDAFDDALIEDGDPLVINFALLQRAGESAWPT